MDIVFIVRCFCMSDYKIERVARAIYETGPRVPMLTWEGLKKYNCAEYKRAVAMARAAIEELEGKGE